MRYLLILALSACSATATRQPSSATFHCVYMVKGEPDADLQFSRTFGGTLEVSWNGGKSWEKLELTPSPGKGQEGYVSWHAGTITDRAYFAFHIPEDVFHKDSFEGSTLFSTEDDFDPMTGDPFPSGERGLGKIRCNR